jgi:hypothetical protein
MTDNSLAMIPQVFWIETTVKVPLEPQLISPILSINPILTQAVNRPIEMICGWLLNRSILLLIEVLDY